MERIVNNKSMMHFMLDKMNGLENKTVSTAELKAYSVAAREVSRIYEIEQRRTDLIIKLDQYNRENNTHFSIRNLDAKEY